MYAICHTKSDDVKAALNEMKKRGVSYPIVQVGQKLYKQMEKDKSVSNSRVTRIIAKKSRKFFINLSTSMVHKQGCSKQGKKFIEAYLVRPKDTGLPLCSLCMK